MSKGLNRVLFKVTDKNAFHRRTTPFWIPRKWITNKNEPDSISGLHPNPLGDGPVLPHLLRQLSLDTQGFVRRLITHGNFRSYQYQNITKEQMHSFYSSGHIRKQQNLTITFVFPPQAMSTWSKGQVTWYNHVWTIGVVGVVNESNKCIAGS